VTKVDGLHSSVANEVLKIEMSPKDHPSVRLEVLYQISTTSHIFGEFEKGHPKVPVMYRGRKKIYRIVYISRLDAYSGP
jgi:hypothetical protein